MNQVFLKPEDFLNDEKAQTIRDFIKHLESHPSFPKSILQEDLNKVNASCYIHRDVRVPAITGIPAWLFF